MEIKIFEIRDKGATVKAMAIRLGPPETSRETRMLAAAGFGDAAADHQDYILLGNMDGGSFKLTYDPYEQTSRTMQQAHCFLRSNWDNTPGGALIDIQFILGETDHPKLTEFGE